MATHSSTLAWRILGTGEPGGLPAMGSHRVRRDWNNLAAAAALFIITPNREKTQMSFNGGMSKQTDVRPIMEYHSAIEKNVFPVHMTTSTNLKGIMLGKGEDPRG